MDILGRVLLVLHLVRADAGAQAEIIVLTAANLLATVMRFVLLRLWVFRSQRTPAPTRIEPRTSRDEVTSRDAPSRSDVPARQEVSRS